MMKKVLCILAILLSMLLSVISVNDKEQAEPIEQEVIYVKTEKIEPVKQNEKPKVEEVKEITKTTEEIKLEEFNSKLDKIKHLKEENKEEWFIAYKDLTYEYVEWIEQSETVFDAFTEDEVRLICRVVETETYDQDFDSKVNVANVVFNRLDDGRFGDTITESITAPIQFCYGRKNITESTIWAVMYAYEMEDTTQGALYFHSFEEATQTFNRASYLFSDKAIHHFYGFKEE